MFGEDHARGIATRVGDVDVRIGDAGGWRMRGCTARGGARTVDPTTARGFGFGGRSGEHEPARKRGEKRHGEFSAERLDGSTQTFADVVAREIVVGSSLPAAARIVARARQSRDGSDP